MPIQITGLAALLKDLSAKAAILDKTEARRVFRGGARIIGEQARSEAPRGRDSVEPGRLRRSIVWFLGQRKGRPGARQLESFARVNVLSGRVVARHGLIIEAGRGPVSPRTASILRFTTRRQSVFARRVPAVAPNPFFRRAIDQSQGSAARYILSGLSDIVAA